MEKQTVEVAAVEYEVNEILDRRFQPSVSNPDDPTESTIYSIYLQRSERVSRVLERMWRRGQHLGAVGEPVKMSQEVGQVSSPH